ncbi:FMN reductase [Saccharopolyspora taberi]|uniref:FMN reductase n=1 Tax=Saccharopolyspora taberi TaxID=60895 RepID=A0ABN3VE80_9PSEU
MSERTIVAISAGIGQPSSTRMLADRLSAAVTEQLAVREITADVRTVELRDVAHDVVNAMLTGFPAGELTGVLDAVTGADGLIAVTPLFTTTYSGLFKSFVDILDNESLTGKPVLLGATGGTPRHSLALEYSMRPLFTYLHAEVTTTSVFAATDDWAGEGDKVNPLPARIRRAGRELAEAVAAREPSGPADPYGAVPDFEQMMREL